MLSPRLATMPWLRRTRPTMYTATKTTTSTTTALATRRAGYEWQTSLVPQIGLLDGQSASTVQPQRSPLNEEQTPLQHWPLFAHGSAYVRHEQPSGAGGGGQLPALAQDWPAGQHVRLAALPHEVVPDGQPHLPLARSMHAVPL